MKKCEQLATELHIEGVTPSSGDISASLTKAAVELRALRSSFPEERTDTISLGISASGVTALEALDLLERASELEPAEPFQPGVPETVLYGVLRAIEAYRKVSSGGGTA
jgi:hypothetical protein